jgi:hypothetical protein
LLLARKAKSSTWHCNGRDKGKVKSCLTAQLSLEASALKRTENNGLKVQKVSGNMGFMEEASVNERLWAIAERFSVPKPIGFIATARSPFDISRPNSHDSKAEFLLEKQAIGSALENARPLLDLVLNGVSDQNARQHGAIRKALKFVDESVRSKRRVGQLETVFDLMRSNALSIGLSPVLVFLLFDFVEALELREQELKGQEAVFWSGVGRAPNHYARTIALRFAKLVARAAGRKPTFGTARDGGHPSTEFGRALEEIFKILDVGADVRNAAKWAISQLTEEDMNPPVRNALAGQWVGGLAGITWEDPKDVLVKAMLGKSQ